MASDPQLKLRTFTVAPVRERGAPSLIEAAGVVPVAGGCMTALPLTAEQRAAVERLVYEMTAPDGGSPYNPIRGGIPGEQAAMRDRLLGMASKPYQTTMPIAGRLLRDHGERARIEWQRMWTPAWPVKRSAVDNLLSRAGVPS